MHYPSMTCAPDSSTSVFFSPVYLPFFIFAPTSLTLYVSLRLKHWEVPSVVTAKTEN